MNWQRIKALVQRNLTLSFRGIDPLIDIFYWPLFDYTVWGFTSQWVQANETQPIMLIWLSGFVLWQACYRANLDICFNFLNELWSRNIVNLFATPLELSEWIVSSLIVGSLSSLITVLFGSIVVYMLYGLNIYIVGLFLIPLFLLLLCNGWSIGFLSSSFLVLYGQKAQKIVWVLGWFFVPFNAIFFPVEFLPAWARIFASMFPMSYIFKSLRIFIVDSKISYNDLLIALTLSVVYLILSLVLFTTMYKKSKEKGLARLEAE